ncbi:hypothetical protein ACYF6T_04700 [Streptomyces sp. 7R007]
MWLTTAVLYQSVFRTADLPPGERFEAWTQRLGRAHAPMEPAGDRAADHRGSERVIQRGEATVWPAVSDPLVFRRTPKPVRRSDPEVHHLSLLRQGEGAANWQRCQVVYGADDIHTNSCSTEYEIRTGRDPFGIVGVELPRTQVALPARRADEAVGRVVSGREGVGALLAQFPIQPAADVTPYRPQDAARLGTVRRPGHGRLRARRGGRPG